MLIRLLKNSLIMHLTRIHNNAFIIALRKIRLNLTNCISLNEKINGISKWNELSGVFGLQRINLTANAGVKDLLPSGRTKRATFEATILNLQNKSNKKPKNSNASHNIKQKQGLPLKTALCVLVISSISSFSSSVSLLRMSLRPSQSLTRLQPWQVPAHLS